MKLLARACLMAGVLMFAAPALCQTAAPSALLARLPNTPVDSYTGLLTVVKSIGPVKGSTADKWFGNLSLDFGGFLGVGTQYKQNAELVGFGPTWHVTKTVALYAWLAQSGSLSSFSLANVTLSAVNPVVGVSYTVVLK